MWFASGHANNKQAVEKFLSLLPETVRGLIYDRQATVKKRQPDGTVKEEIDADMRQYITMKLIESLPQFPLEELEQQNR